MKYPTLAEVESANHELICRWYRFLPSPTCHEETTILNSIVDEWKKKGGLTTDISKKIGWDEKE